MPAEVIYMVLVNTASIVAAKSTYLDVPPRQVFQIAHRIFVLDVSRDNIREYLHLAMRVCAETRAVFNTVLVDDTKCAVLLVCGIADPERQARQRNSLRNQEQQLEDELFKAKAMMRDEPAKVRAATLLVEIWDELDSGGHFQCYHCRRG